LRYKKIHNCTNIKSIADCVELAMKRQYCHYWWGCVRARSCKWPVPDFKYYPRTCYWRNARKVRNFCDI